MILLITTLSIVSARMLFWFLLVVGSVSGQGPRSMTISAILDEDGDEIHELAFNHAVQVVNRNR